MARRKFPKCDHKFGNLIDHASKHDGTKRSAQACHIIRKYNPKTAKDVANILAGDRNRNVKTIEDVEYPMFFDNKKLVNYCKKEKTRWKNYCVSHVDSVDISADLWELSPTLRKKYAKPMVIKSPTFGTGTFEGWHRLKEDIGKELRKKRKDIIW